MVAVVASSFIADALWDDDLANLNPVPAAAKALDRELRARNSARRTFATRVLIADPDRQAALRRSEAMDRALQAAVDRKWLAGFDIATRYIPSDETQSARRAALPPPPVLAANLAAASANLPFRDGLFAPFQAAVERARVAPPLDRAAFRGFAIGLKIDSLLFEGDGEWVSVVPLQGVRDSEALAKFVNTAGVSRLTGSTSRPKPATWSPGTGSNRCAPSRLAWRALRCFSMRGCGAWSWWHGRPCRSPRLSP